MSKAVDERIVEMQFDNEDFEKDVSTTMSTLDKLKESLSFSKVKDGFEKIQNGILGTNFGPIEEALYRVQDGFGMMEMIGLQAMSRISNAVLDMGQKLVNAVAIEPVKSGFQEYETQIGAVQTIMANTEEAFKGVSEQEHLNAVNDALDELNTYADKTIYNFTEMTKNIGTFTAAGVSLEESKTAIQGIANMAAVSGSTSQQASNAMYQLSQALAAGSVKLMDWNSVVNAGMGGEVFKNALQQSSKAMVVANEKVQALAASGKDANAIAAETGIELSRVEKLIKDGYANSYDTAIEAHGTFRESLTDGWITSEVLIDALRNATLNLDNMTEEEEKTTRAMLEANGYTQEQIEDIFRLGKSADEAATKVKTFSQLIDTTKEALQSGWTQSWEYIIGDFGEAKSLWTSISEYLGDAINKSAEARNTILEQWHKDHGRDNLIEGLKLSFQGLVSYVSVAKNIFDDFIPKITVETLKGFSNTILAIGKKIQPTSEQLEAFRVRLSHFVQPLEIIKDFLKSFIKPYQETFINTFKNTGIILGEVIDRIGMFIDFISGMIRVSHIPGKLAEAITAGVAKIGTAFISVYDHVKEFLRALTGFSFDFFDPKNGNWEEAGIKLGETIDKIRWKVVELKDKAGELISSFKEWFTNLTGINLDKIFSWDNFIKGVIRFRLFIKTLPQTVSEFKDSLNNGFLSTINDFTGLNLHIPTWEEFKSAITGIGETITHWKDNFDQARAAVVAFLEGIWTRLEPIRNGFNHARESVVNFFKSFKKEENPDAEEGIGVMDRLAVIGSKIKDAFEKIAAFVSNFVKMAWTKLQELREKIDFKQIFAGLLGGAGTIGLLNLASLTGTVTQTIKKGGLASLLEFVDDIGKRLKKGVEMVQEVLEPFGDTLAAFQNKLKADMLKNIALAVAILVGSIIVISTVDKDDLVKGIGAIGALMTELLGAVAIFTKTVDSAKTKDFASMAIGLVEFAGAILILTIATKTIADMDPEKMFQGLLGIATLLLMLNFTASNLQDVDNGKDISKACTAMIGLAIAVKLLIGAVEKLGSFDPDQLGQGLIGVGILIGSLGLFTKFSAAEKMGIKSGIGLILLATAISMLSKTVIAFAELGWDKVDEGLYAVAMILGTLGLFTRFSEAEKMGVRSGLGIMAIAKAIGMLANTTLLFVDLNMEQINNGLYAVAMILGTLGLFTRFSNVDKVGLLNGIGIILLAKGIQMVSEIAKEFSKMGWEEITKGLVAVSVMLAGVGAAAYLMKNSAGGAIAILAIAVGLNMLLPVMKSFAAMSWEEIIKAVSGLAGVFAILGLSAMVIAPFVPALLGIAGAMLMIGAATVLFGAGVGILTTAVSVLRNLGGVIKAVKWEMYIDIIKKVLGGIFGAIADLLPSLITIAANMVTALLTGIMQNVPLLLMAIRIIGLGVLGLIRTFVPKIVETVVYLLVQLLTVIDENINKFIILGASILLKLMNGIAIVAPELMNAGVNMIIALIDGMARALVENADKLMISLQNLVWSIVYTLLALVQEAAKKIPGIGSAISEKIEGVKETVKSKINYTDAKNTTDEAMQGIVDAINEGGNKAVEAAGEAGTGIEEGLKTNTDGASTGEGFSFDIANGVTSGSAMDKIMSAGSEVGGALFGGFSSGGDSASTGAGFSFGIAEGATNDKSIAKMVDAGETNAMSLLEGFSDTDTSMASTNLVDKIQGSMTSKENLQTMTDTGEDVGEAADSGFGGTYDDFYKSGGHVMDGAALGISDNAYKVKDAATSAGTEAYNAYNTATGVSSPSWKFAQSGMFQMMGGAEGIRKNVGLLTSAASYAGNETVDAFSDSVSELSELANLDIDDAPSIRPVMDLGGIQNGIGRLNTMLSRDMAQSVAVGMPRRIDIGSAIGDFGAIQNRGNSDLLGALKAQMEQTERLIYVLENQMLYLDGDTLVGKTVSRMDNALGKRAILAGRRGRG